MGHWAGRLHRGRPEGQRSSGRQRFFSLDLSVTLTSSLSIPNSVPAMHSTTLVPLGLLLALSVSVAASPLQIKGRVRPPAKRADGKFDKERYLKEAHKVQRKFGLVKNLLSHNPVLNKAADLVATSSSTPAESPKITEGSITSGNVEETATPALSARRTNPSPGCGTLPLIDVIQQGTDVEVRPCHLSRCLQLTHTLNQYYGTIQVGTGHSAPAMAHTFD